MLTSFLTAYCARDSGAVAFVQTPRDVIATREMSVRVDKSLFTYKNCHASHFISRGRRGESPEYVGSVFGEVKCMEKLVRVPLHIVTDPRS